MKRADDMPLDLMLSRHLDGDLTPAEQQRLDALLAQDETARSRLRTLQRARELLRGAAEATRPTDELLARLAAIGREEDQEALGDIPPALLSQPHSRQMDVAGHAKRPPRRKRRK